MFLREDSCKDATKCCSVQQTTSKNKKKTCIPTESHKLKTKQDKCDERYNAVSSLIHII